MLHAISCHIDALCSRKTRCKLLTPFHGFLVKGCWRCSYAGCGLAHDYALLTLDRDIGNQVRALQSCI